jgi:nicotinamidase-related amidase
MAALSIPVRYFSMHNESADDIVEANTKYSHANWPIDPEKSALVLVDFWTTHIIRSHLERCEQVIDQRVVPVLAEARRTGIPVIHGPGIVSKKYPQWKLYAEEAEMEAPEKKKEDWPPEEFRKREGPYAPFARPFLRSEDKERAEEFFKIRRMPEAVGPEPEDFVIASGAQLHRLLKDKGILHLFYMGFATNECVLNKNYGVKAMQGRGYNIILIRDCTTGIETSETIDSLSATAVAVQYIEMKNASTTSKEFLEACRG